MEEIWKDVVGYEGLYKVSNLGRVKGLERTVKTPYGIRVVPEKIMVTRTRKTGYIFVGLSKNNKQTMIKTSRLVSKAFILNPENKPTVNHKDGNKSNNTVENLEWATRSEQMIHSYSVLNRKKLGRNLTPENDPMCKKIYQYTKDKVFIMDYVGIGEASRITGINRNCISMVATNYKHRKTSGGYIWSFTYPLP